MAASGILPRFFKVFLSQLCSESMMIPSSYNDELPHRLAKTATLYGNGGCFWTVEMMRKREDVYLGQGWSKFAEDNQLKDGDLLVFVYDGDRRFEVSVFGHTACKETRVKIEEITDDTEDSSDTNTSDEPELVTSIPGDCPEKSIVLVEDSEEDGYNDSIYDPPEIEDITMERMATENSREVAEDSEEGDSYNDSDYSPSNIDEDRTTIPITTDSKKKGKGKLARPRHVEDKSIASSSKRRNMYKGKPKIKNPEAYLTDPNNLYFETQLKSRPYELLIRAQLVKDYDLVFEEHINYVDEHGKLGAEALKWNGDRTCIRNWHQILNRNKVKKEDRILCELVRNQNVVYEIKVHVVRKKDL